MATNDKDNQPATKNDVRALKQELLSEIESKATKSDVDKRFDDIDQRLESMDKRLDKMDQRLDDFQSMVKAGFEQVISDIKSALVEGNQIESERLNRCEIWMKEMETENLPIRVSALETVVKDSH